MTKTGMQIRPIRTKGDHKAAVKRIEELIQAEPGTPEGDELDVLATLVDAYEAKHHAIDPPDAITAIQFRMEQQNLTRKDLEPLVGSRARVSEILTGTRPLTLQMIRRLKDGLGISADLLISSAPALNRSRTSVRTKRTNSSVPPPAAASRRRASHTTRGANSR